VSWPWPCTYAFTSLGVFREALPGEPSGLIFLGDADFMCSRVCPLHALAGNSFFSPGMAVNLLDLALQYKGGKSTLRFE
jgi:hypothetical protein